MPTCITASLQDEPSRRKQYNDALFSAYPVLPAVLPSRYILLCVSCDDYNRRYNYPCYLDRCTHPAADDSNLVVPGSFRAHAGDALAACPYPADVTPIQNSDALVAAISRKPGQYYDLEKSHLSDGQISSWYALIYGSHLYAYTYGLD